MKTITVHDFEQNFDVIMEDVIENHRHYKIIDRDGRAVMLMPYTEYECLVDTYNDWLETTKETPEV